MRLPRLVIGGTQSGVGKTTITTGILGTLTKHGLRVQAYKVGPDYIDPGYHTLVTGIPSRNLDGWMVDDISILQLFKKASSQAQFSLVEGVMGLYDGVKGEKHLASTAAIAKLLQAPVILIVDAHGAATSVAAMVLGFKVFDPEVNIAGVFLNRVGSVRHLDMIQNALDTYCPLPVIGFLEKDVALKMPERHLGLVPAGEDSTVKEVLAQITDRIARNLDLETLLKIAHGAPPLPHVPEITVGEAISGHNLQVAVAYDDAFNFYYQDNFDLLESYGIKILKFSPLQDKALPPNIHGIILGGGYPEVFLTRLSANQAMLQELRNACIRGVPIYAECGGYMYLTEGVIDFSGAFYPLAGIIPGKSQMNQRLSMLGYAEGTLMTDCLLGERGTKLKGHEFHYSTMLESDDKARPLYITYTRKKEPVYAGYAAGNVFASYLHLHFAGNRGALHHLIKAWRLFQEKGAGVEQT
ncbi:MAG: cobyrinic acid a,c-diamide synthase [Peptococcaceae bacterium]|jgi:cobyrinic acid a,c-diamide synthase|nr:cobyrinic acid a,c-diamide synthase [Peptococcaceae bacterium]